MSLDAALSSVAKSVLRQYGRQVTVTRRAGADGTYNEATGQVEGGTAQAFTCYGSVQSFTRDSLDGSIKRGDMKVLVAASDATFQPRAQDRITVDGNDYEVVSVLVAEGTGTSILYTLQARR